MLKIDTKKSNAIKAFEKLGFHIVNEREHIKMRNEQGITLSLPNHKKIKGSTLTHICRNAGIDKNEFFKLV